MFVTTKQTYNVLYIGNNFLSNSYNLIFLAVTYVAPMSVMVWAYARMSAALRGRAIGECTHHQMQVVRAKRKVSSVKKKHYNADLY